MATTRFFDVSPYVATTYVEPSLWFKDFSPGARAFSRRKSLRRKGLGGTSLVIMYDRTQTHAHTQMGRKSLLRNDIKAFTFPENHGIIRDVWFDVRSYRERVYTIGVRGRTRWSTSPLKA